MENNPFSQCWFCHQINLASVGAPTPCPRCGMLPKEHRPDTSALQVTQNGPVPPVQLLPAPAVLQRPLQPAPYPHWEESSEPAIQVPEQEHGTVEGFAVPAPIPLVWGLTTEHGDYVPLNSDLVIVGRRPTETPGATLAQLPDPTKTLSRTHARLCRDATSDTWTIEDLGSSNGVTVFDDTLTRQTTLSPGVPAVATSFLVLGTMRVRLTRHSQNGVADQ